MKSVVKKIFMVLIMAIGVVLINSTRVFADVVVYDPGESLGGYAVLGIVVMVVVFVILAIVSGVVLYIVLKKDNGEVKPEIKSEMNSNVAPAMGSAPEFTSMNNVNDNSNNINNN